MTFIPTPKHTRYVDSQATALARRRDGVCLYGLLHKDGCKGCLDGHHIEARGEGGDDVIENIISLCRWHHGMAEDRRISKEELKAILALYHRYHYEGIKPWTRAQYLQNSGGKSGRTTY
ncbi:MAG TPA: HNH endonuclease [Anaerolineales bacterium]|nr:HNH endonuclease [Anaerolineales bacterium]